MKNINIDDLFVACPVVDCITATWSFEQCGPPGGEEHTVVINPRKILVIRTVENNEEVYRDASTGKKIIPSYYEKSYHKVNFTMREDMEYPCYRMPISIPFFWRLPKNGSTSRFGYIIPFKEYIENVLGKNLDTVSKIGAKTLLMVTNVSCDRPFELSEKYEEAKKQIDTKVLRKEKRRSQE